MNVLTYWNDVHRGVPEVKTAAEIERYLQTAAADIARFLSNCKHEGEVTRYRHEHWYQVGVDPVEACLSADGAAFVRDDRLRVMIKAQQPRLRQRYTVAHEIGHVLLRQVMQENADLDLPAKLEEVMCDEFAAQMLVPSAQLKTLMDDMRSPPTSQDLLKWCGELQVNIEPMMIAAKRNWRWGAAAIVYCESYSHRKGSEPALRIVGYVGEDMLFLPVHKRVSSIGLDQLNGWFTDTVEPYGGGEQAEVRLPLYARDLHSRSGQVEGSVQWSAMRMRERSVRGAGRAFVDLKLIGDWSVRWAGGKPITLNPARFGKAL